MNKEDSMKMLTLIFPCTENKTQKKAGFTVKGHLFSSIFRENNYKQRDLFFSEPLTQYLWGKIFIEECPEISITHLRRIRSLPSLGEPKFNKLLTTMNQLETEFNFKMIPKIAQSDVKVFSKEEQVADMV